VGSEILVTRTLAAFFLVTSIDIHGSTQNRRTSRAPSTCILAPRGRVVWPSRRVLSVRPPRAPGQTTCGEWWRMRGAETRVARVQRRSAAEPHAAPILWPSAALSTCTQRSWKTESRIRRRRTPSHSHVDKLFSQPHRSLHHRRQ
jgi:hypothetical protein